MESQTRDPGIAGILQSPFTAFSAVAAGLCTLWGLIELYQFVNDKLGSKPAAIFVGVLALVLIAPACLSLFVLNFRRQFYLPKGERLLHLSVTRNWRIAEDGSANLENRATYFFFKPKLGSR